jgi:hypothetical protein
VVSRLHQSNDFSPYEKGVEFSSKVGTGGLCFAMRTGNSDAAIPRAGEICALLASS